MKLLDVKLVQNNSEKGRSYTVPVGKKLELPSVTTIIDKVEPKDFLKTWQDKLAKEQDVHNLLTNNEREVLGKHLAIKERDRIGSNGTYNHNLIEEFLLHKKVEDSKKTKEFVRLLPFLDKVQPIALEQPIYYYNDFDESGNFSFEGTTLGYAGTLDAILQLEDDLIYDDQTIAISKDEIVIADWKFYGKTKSIKGFNRKTNSWYYPLLKCGLQLSAYYCAIMDLIQRDINLIERFSKNKFEKLLLVQSPISARDISLILYTLDDIQFYFNNFINILLCLHNNEEFNWLEFCENANYNDHLGRKVYLKK